MRIAVAGIGYVGLSMAVLLAMHHEVLAYDIVEAKVKMINQRISPLQDKEIIHYFQNENLNLTAVSDTKEAFSGADYVIVSTPTNYDENSDCFDTSAVEAVIEEVLKYNQHCHIVIKSTIPVGYVEKIRIKYQTNRIFFSPEFLREGSALYDNLYPSRIVVGDQSKAAQDFAHLLLEGAKKKDVPVLLTNPTEAEAIKLFANTYLAMRVAYFNEIDTYCEMKNLNTKAIIEGIGYDERIGSHYNNPSFGYGGYCLPKDTKQLKANYHGIPQEMISAIVDANSVRKQHIAEMILQRQPKTVGIYRLAMKKNSDNFRKSAILDVIELLKGHCEIIIYEPHLKEDIAGTRVEKNLDTFKQQSDVIVVNRFDECLEDVKEKLYTRDIYERD